jgi:tape measure domain-containing protein
VAKGNRDVELVIRAKNEASKALGAVSSALDTLTKSQANVAKGSDKTSGLLADLGAELSKLNSQIGGMSTLDRLSNSMEKAAGSVVRLEQGLASLTDDQAKLAAEISKTESALAGLNTQSTQMQQTLTKQSAAAKAAKAELAALNEQVKAGETSLGNSVKNSQKYETQLQSLEAKLTATKVKHRDLTQEILNAETPSNKLVAAFERTDAALIKQSAALAKAQASYAGTAGATKEIESSLARLRTAQVTAAAAFEQSSASQQKTAASLKEVGGAVRDAAKQLSTLKATAEGNAASLERQDAALKQSRVQLDAVKASALQADVALEKIGGTVRQRLLRSLVDSQVELKKYQQAWQESTAAVSRAIAAGEKTATPSPELSANIAIAKASKIAYLELQVALQQMRTAVREAGTDVIKLSGAQQTFVSALDRVKGKTLEVAAAQQKLTGAAATAGSAVVTTAARQANAYQQVGGSVSRMANEANKAGKSLTDLEAKGRQALSWGQRLNSEMIALATSFVGVYAAIQQLTNVTKTFQDMEAVSSRLGVAFGGNTQVIGREMRWLQEEADRLGIDIRVLASEYSKLAIATKGSALEGKATRDIFISLSEAFRVSKLSSAQMEGAFNAITQMVSKGNVSMEELRQQLGERLYGAFTLAGKAMGKTGKELSDLIATGKLATDEFLPKFAQQLNETFGPQLPDALKSLTTEIGQFQNELTKAQMQVAKGGFIEGLRVGLETLTVFFKSDEGVRFFNSLGAAAGGLIKVIAALPKYFDEISIVLGVLVARKATGWFTDMAAGATKFTAAMKPLPAAIAATTSSYNAFSGVGGQYMATTAATLPLLTRMQLGLTGLRTNLVSTASTMTLTRASTLALAGSMNVLRGAFALVGGLPGLLITGLTMAFGYWLTSTNDVIDTTSKHEEQMTRLIDLYARTKGGAEGWAVALKEVNVLNASKVAEQMRDQLQEEISKISVTIETNGLGRLRLARGDFGDIGKELFDLLRKAETGQITINALSKRLNELGSAASGASPEIKKALIDASEMVTSAAKLESGLSKQVLIAEKAGGAISNVSPAVRELTKDLDSLAEAAGVNGGVVTEKLVDPSVKLGEALDQLLGKVPSLTDELKLLEQTKEIDEILKTADAIVGLDKTSAAYLKLVDTAKKAKAELQAAFDEKQFKESYNLLAKGGSGVEQSAALLRQREGFQGTAKWDVNAFRAGFGSDTTTLADGTIQKITEGMKVSVADANRDLIRRIGEFQDVIRGQVGKEKFASLDPQQQAVLTSVAYNYGSLPKEIAAAVREGSAQDVSAAIRGRATDNNGVNSGRRNQEAYLYQASPQINAEANTKLVEEELKAGERKQEQADQYHQRLGDTLELKRQEAELKKQEATTEQRRTLQEEVNLAIVKATNDAKKAGTELTDAEKQKITEITTNLYQIKAAEDAIAKAKKDQEEAEGRINTLTQTRRDLLEQMRFALETGNTESYEALKAQLIGVETQLMSVIDAQIKFWETAADPEKAAAAIANLNTLKNSLGKVNETIILSSFNAGKLFGDNLISFADNFLAKIRETGDVLGSLKDAFRQFASDFLLQMAQMILKQAIFNALQAAMGGTSGGIGGGILSAFGVGVQHNGGVTGSGNRQRSVSPTWFSNATRYHTGGVAGLRPNEVPTILEKGEEVLPASDPRHVNNGGGSSSAQSVKIVNAIDAGSFVSAGVDDVQGQKAILNFMRANSSAVKGALGV